VRAAGPAAGGPVTLVVVNARVWTGAPRRPWADAVVVRGDRLLLVGGSAEARKLALAAPDARVVDARGRLLVAARGAPGLGTLESGGPADFVVVDRDLARVTPEALATRRCCSPSPAAAWSRSDRRTGPPVGAIACDPGHGRRGWAGRGRVTRRDGCG
jgi:predicted amidohydrolase YtcJ